MKKIVFIRHGKSSWSHNLPDIDRPLKERGVKDGKLVGTKLKNLEIQVDKIFSSPANRAFSTCKLIMNKLGIPIAEVDIIDDLYDFSGGQVISFVKNLNDDIDSVMIFGHNYAFTSLVNQLGNKYITNLPTTGMVRISFDVESWINIKDGETELILFPKELR